MASEPTGNPPSETTPQLLLYPQQNDFIGKITISKSESTKKVDQSDITTIVILDRSGSMGDEVERFTTRILGGVFEKLHYKPTDQLYLIHFDNTAETILTSVEQLKHVGITSRGGTHMSTAIIELAVLFDKLQNKHETIRILTISDGQIIDQDATQIRAQNLAGSTKGKVINSQAVRLFTSSSQPDTRGLSSVLQLNNIGEVNLLDVSVKLSDEDLISEISNLFSDNLMQRISLKSVDKVFKPTPWMDHTDTITLLPGKNIFWLEKLPQEVTIDQQPIQVVLQPKLDLDTYSNLFKTKIQYYLTQLRILKVIDTEESLKKLDGIVKYFREVENVFINDQEDVKLLLNDPSLRSRLEYLRVLAGRRGKTMSVKMAQIANDERVSQLNSAQQAEYLRNVGVGKNSRGLAKRALKGGVSFFEKIMVEVEEMDKHLEELKEVDDAEHSLSFFSRDTTVGGIRGVCELFREGVLGDLSKEELFLLFNIVGVACSGPIGDFPDGMNWWVNELHLGCYASLSDVLMANMQAEDKKLRSPGINKEITNVIPVFDDIRVMKFLRKYAPTILEYVASIGMRRIIAEIPMTCGYMIGAGVWKSLQLLDSNKSELHIKTFERLLNNYSDFSSSYFDYVLPFIKEQNQGRNLYYIGNNGIANMILPLFKIIKTDPSKKRFLPEILRAIYSHEIWQATRRLYKNKPEQDTLFKSILYKLLGIDLEKNRTPLAPKYELEPPTIKHHDEPNYNHQYLDELTKNFHAFPYIALIPSYFQAVASNLSDSIKNIPKLDETFVSDQLKIGYDLKTYHLYNILQSLFHPSNSSRVEAESTKILDLKYKEDFEQTIREYISKQFHKQYLLELSKKKRQEQIDLADELVESLLKSTEYSQLVSLLSTGLTRGSVILKIINSSSLGYKTLQKKLTDLTIDIPLRTDLIRLFLLCRDRDGQPVWNKGGVNFVNLKEFGKVFAQLGKTEEWEAINKEYKSRGLHIYRELMNRHGHNNSKPSYWAFGYQSLQDFKNNVTEEEFKKYCTEHSTCCGVKYILKWMKLDTDE